MFGTFKNMGDLLKLAQDENFRKFFTHPKVQELMKNPEFEKVIKEKNIFKLMSDEAFTKVLQDPEIRSALEGMRGKFSPPS